MSGLNSVRVIIIRAPGTNCDEETAYGFKLAGAQAEIIRVREIIQKPSLLNEYKILVIPGGFSYGDDLGAGKILANELILNLSDELYKFVMSGKIVLGICNGFQVLTKMGMLPDISIYSPKNKQKKFFTNMQKISLGFNKNRRFECRWVCLRIKSKNPIFFKDLDEVISLPVAHGEGRVILKNAAKLYKDLLRNKQIALEYCLPDGRRARGRYPYNPNGAYKDIAGIFDKTGRVMGLMPHPERFIFKWAMPGFDKLPYGLRILRNIVDWSRHN